MTKTHGLAIGIFSFSIILLLGSCQTNIIGKAGLPGQFDPADCARPEIICIGSSPPADVPYIPRFQLDTPGATYVLLEDVIVTNAGDIAFVTAADGVTFDGNNHTLGRIPDEWTEGFLIHNGGFTLKNLIAIWKFQGYFLESGASGSDRLHVADSVITNGSISVNGRNVTFEDNIFNESTVTVQRTSGGVFSGNLFYYNESYESGLGVFTSESLIIRDNVFSEKAVGQFGVNDSIIANNTFMSSLTISFGQNNTLQDNVLNYSERNGIYLSNSHNNTIINNKVETDDSFDQGVIRFSNSHNNSFSNNTVVVKNAWNPPLALEGSSDNFFSSNTFMDGVRPSNSGYELRTNSSRNTFMDNRISFAENGFFLEETSQSNYFYNNTFIGNDTGTAVSVYSTSTDNSFVRNIFINASSFGLGALPNRTVIVGNTFHSWGHFGLEIHLAHDSPEKEVIVRDNLFSSIENGLIVFDMENMTAYDGDYNLLYRQNAGWLVYFNSTYLTNLSSFAQLTGNESHSINRDPSFVRPYADFRLGQGSPAIDAGVVVPGIHCLHSDDEDPSQEGCVHWNGRAPDLGAFESDGTEPLPQDTLAPVITFAPPDAVYGMNAVGLIDWVLSDETAPGNFTVLRNGTVQNQSLSWLTGVPVHVVVNTQTSGTWNYTILYDDAAGNTGIPDTVEVTIEASSDAPPLVTLENPPDRFITLNPNVSLMCSAIDDSALANLTLYDNASGWEINYSTTENSINHTLENLSLGSYVWNCLAYDNASQHSWGTNRTFYVVNESCSQPFSCTQWSQGTCGDRTCTCACPGDVGCTGDNTTHLDCPPPDNPPGGSPLVLKGGGSPSIFKGGGSPLFGKLDIIRNATQKKTDVCKDGKDDEGTPPAANGCVDGADADCGGKETLCTDGLDNDCDNLTDCGDPDCATYCSIISVNQESSTLSGGNETQGTNISGGQDKAPREEVTSQVEGNAFLGPWNWIAVGIIAIAGIAVLVARRKRAAAADPFASFVQKKQAEGLSKDAIVEKLKSVGWTDEAIDAKFKGLGQAPQSPAPAAMSTTAANLPVTPSGHDPAPTVPSPLEPQHPENQPPAS